MRPGEAVEMFHRHHRPEPGPQLTPWGFYAVTPAKRQHDPLRVIAISAVIAVVLTLGGCFAAVGVVAHRFGTAFEVAATPVTATTSREVHAGRSFLLSGFRAAQGWALQQEPHGGPMTITGLRVTNTGVQATNLRYAFTFRRGSEWLAEIDCFCPSAEPGETVPMQCSRTARVPLGYDTVLVTDSF